MGGGVPEGSMEGGIEIGIGIEIGEVLDGIPECKWVQRVQAAAGLSPWAAGSARDRLRLPGWFKG